MQFFLGYEEKVSENIVKQIEQDSRSTQCGCAWVEERNKWLALVEMVINMWIR